MGKIFISAILMMAVLSPAFAKNGKKVLIEEKVLSENKYMIIARGYPNPSLTDQIRIKGTAWEAAILNAQILAGERFIQGFDVVKNGIPESFIAGDGWVDVVYIITYPDIAQYLRDDLNFSGESAGYPDSEKQ
jgi:hypothetical protein